MSLTVDCNEALPVAADLELIDLVDNALRATDPGGHVICLATRIADSVRIQAADTGIGIQAAEIGLVTQRFYRTREGRRRNRGDGLGLAIMAEICSRHGLRLELTSDADGTTASFELYPGNNAA